MIRGDKEASAGRMERKEKNIGTLCDKRVPAKVKEKFIALQLDLETVGTT